jgi:hypothetical protein
MGVIFMPLIMWGEVPETGSRKNGEGGAGDGKQKKAGDGKQKRAGNLNPLFSH